MHIIESITNNKNEQNCGYSQRIAIRLQTSTRCDKCFPVQHFRAHRVPRSDLTKLLLPAAHKILPAKDSTIIDNIYLQFRKQDWQRFSLPKNYKHNFPKRDM